MRKRGYLDRTPAELRARRVAFSRLALFVMPPLLTLRHVNQFLCQATWDSNLASLVALAPLFPWMLYVALLMLIGIGVSIVGAFYSFAQDRFQAQPPIILALPVRPTVLARMRAIIRTTPIIWRPS
jgi:hypothetical protein